MQDASHLNPSEPKMRYADDDRYSVRALALLRLPSLLAGLFLGFVISFATSRFEEVLVRYVEVAFFIPFIVYMASAVGAQTQSIYLRDLRTGKANFHTYLVKETALGVILGVFFGAVAWSAVALWFGPGNFALAVGLSMMAVVSTAPLVSLLVTELFQLEHSDPAVGAGPIATVVQDTISVTLYGLIATTIILH